MVTKPSSELTILSTTFRTAMSVGLTRVHEFIARRWIRPKKIPEARAMVSAVRMGARCRLGRNATILPSPQHVGQDRTKRGCIAHKCPHAGHPAGRADLARSMRCERARWTRSEHLVRRTLDWRA